MVMQWIELLQLNKKKESKMQQVIMTNICTVFGLGNFTKMPGTLGSIAGVFLGLLLLYLLPIQLVIVFFIFLLAASLSASGCSRVAPPFAAALSSSLPLRPCLFHSHYRNCISPCRTGTSHRCLRLIPQFPQLVNTFLPTEIVSQVCSPGQDILIFCAAIDS